MEKVIFLKYLRVDLDAVYFSKINPENTYNVTLTNLIPFITEKTTLNTLSLINDLEKGIGVDFKDSPLLKSETLKLDGKFELKNLKDLNVSKIVLDGKETLLKTDDKTDIAVLENNAETSEISANNLNIGDLKNNEAKQLLVNCKLDCQKVENSGKIQIFFKDIEELLDATILKNKERFLRNPKHKWCTRS